MKIKISIILLALAMVFVLAACSKGDNDSTTTPAPGTTTTTEPAASEYTVTFDTAGGDTVAPQTIAANQYATLPSPAPTKDGYTFAGWFNGATPYAFSATPVTANLTLTAHWTAIEYTVTYANAGDIEDGTYTIETGLELPVAVRRGYALSAWLNDEDEEVTSIPEGTMGNITLTAVWEAYAPELEGYSLEQFTLFDLTDRVIHYAMRKANASDPAPIAPNGLEQTYGTATGEDAGAYYLYNKYDANLSTMFNDATFKMEMLMYKTKYGQLMIEEDGFGDNYIHMWVDSETVFHPNLGDKTDITTGYNEWYNISYQFYAGAPHSPHVYITWDMLVTAGSNAPLQIRYSLSKTQRMLLGTIDPDGTLFVGEDTVTYPFMSTPSMAEIKSPYDVDEDFAITEADYERYDIGQVPLDQWFNIGFQFIQLLDGGQWIGYTVTIYVDGEELLTCSLLNRFVVDFSGEHNSALQGGQIHLFSGPPAHTAYVVANITEPFTYGVSIDNFALYKLTEEDE